MICVCLTDGDAKEQSTQNHFKLSVASDADVDAARAAALSHRDEYRIKRVLDLDTSNGHRAFKMLDLNNTW